jgi:hypothetical protein
MFVLRFLAAATALAAIISPVRADQNLGPARIISGTNKVVLPGGPTLGLWQNNKFISQPDSIQIQGSGSTGDISTMSVTPSAGATAGTVAKAIGDRAPLASPVFTGIIQAPSFSMVGSQNQAVYPIGNPAGINRSSFFSTATSQFENNMEMFNVRNCIANKGNTHTTGNDQYFVAKVCDFNAIQMLPGAGASFVGNDVLKIEPGVGAINAIGREINVYPSGGYDYGMTGPGGESGPLGTGLLITGYGTNYLASAMLINLGGVDGTSGTTNFKLRRGISLYNGTIAGNTYEDLTSSGGSGIYLGGTKAYGIDMSGMTAQLAALHLASNQTVAWRNNANTADLNLVGKDTLDQLMLGYGKNTRFQTATDTDLLVRGKVNLSDGTSLTSANDANSGLRQLEIISAAMRISSALTVTGSLSAPSVSSSGIVSGAYGKVAPTTYASISAAYPCNSTNQGVFGFITDSTTATFNAAVAGGGTNPIGVICNGTNYVVH